MSLIILNLINFITAIVLAFLLIILPGYSCRRNFYFILLLIFLIADLALIHLQMIHWISVQTYVPFGLTLIVWFGPSFYFHSKENDLKKSSHYLLHLIFTALGLWLVFYIGWQVEGVPRWLPTAYFAPVLLVYFIKSIKKGLHDQWVKITFYWFGGLILFFIIESIWLNISAESLIRYSGYTVLTFHLLNLFFVSVGFWFVVRNPDVFSNIKLIRRYQNRGNGISSSELSLVEAFVVKEGNFKNADLSRQKVMNATGISQHRISELVNGHFRKNFNEWVNDLRVEEAKKALVKQDLSIKEIYFSVGFGSKSVFNNAFKSRIGLTPSEFRKSLVF